MNVMDKLFPVLGGVAVVIVVLGSINPSPQVTYLSARRLSYAKCVFRLHPVLLARLQEPPHHNSGHLVFHNALRIPPILQGRQMEIQYVPQ